MYIRMYVIHVVLMYVLYVNSMHMLGVYVRTVHMCILCMYVSVHCMYEFVCTLCTVCTVYLYLFIMHMCIT